MPKHLSLKYPAEGMGVRKNTVSIFLESLKFILISSQIQFAHGGKLHRVYRWKKLRPKTPNGKITPDFPFK